MSHAENLNFPDFSIGYPQDVASSEAEPNLQPEKVDEFIVGLIQKKVEHGNLLNFLKIYFPSAHRYVPLMHDNSTHQEALLKDITILRREGFLSHPEFWRCFQDYFGLITSNPDEIISILEMFSAERNIRTQSKTPSNPSPMTPMHLSPFGFYDFDDHGPHTPEFKAKLARNNHALENLDLAELPSLFNQDGFRTFLEERTNTKLLPVDFFLQEGVAERDDFILWVGVLNDADLLTDSEFLAELEQRFNFTPAHIEHLKNIAEQVQVILETRKRLEEVAKEDSDTESVLSQEREAERRRSDAEHKEDRRSRAIADLEESKLDLSSALSQCRRTGNSLEDAEGLVVREREVLGAAQGRLEELRKGKGELAEAEYQQVLNDAIALVDSSKIRMNDAEQTLVRARRAERDAQGGLELCKRRVEEAKERVRELVGRAPANIGNYTQNQAAA